MSRSEAADLAAFEAERGSLLALAYRMLGDIARAEDLVQEAWLRWRGRAGEAALPRAYLTTLVTRLCLNELGSARQRREESRSDRLPEPIDLEQGGLGAIEVMEQVSMAFLVALQRLTPAERAVLLLHDVFDFDHAEIAGLIERNEPACRKLLSRARENIGAEKRLLKSSRETHERLLLAFLRATSAGDIASLVSLLAEDAVLITDGGPNGRQVGGVRNLNAPLRGAERIAAFVTATTRRNAGLLEPEVRELNGQPAIVFFRAEGVFAALSLGIADERIHRVYFHADLARLRRLGGPRAKRSSEPAS
jgi:RNA polymerase sigma-70 factor (ECF subfamily)